MSTVHHSYTAMTPVSVCYHSGVIRDVEWDHFRREHAVGIVEPDFGATPPRQAHESADRLHQMQHATVVDAVTPVLPEALADDPRMHLTGTLRQRGASYVIEQHLDLDTGGGPRWTTPRIHRVMVTDATRDAARALIDRVVTISGTAGCGDERNRTSIVLDSIRPIERESGLA